MADAIIPFPVARRDVPFSSPRRVKTYGRNNPSLCWGRQFNERAIAKSRAERMARLEHFRGSPVASLVLALLETTSQEQRWAMLHALDRKGPQHEPAMCARSALLEVL